MFVYQLSGTELSLPLRKRQIPGALGYPLGPFYVLTRHELTTTKLAHCDMWHCEHFVIISGAITLVETVCNDLMAIFTQSK